jgi:cell division inhibitor SulA
MSAIARTSHDNHRSAPCERIIEVVVPAAADARPQLTLVLPLLAHLSNSSDGRWLTCIGPSFVAKRDCQRYGINWKRLLQILPNQRVDQGDLCERALAAGRSHTVAFLVDEPPSAELLARLERAARQGNCQGIVIHTR